MERVNTKLRYADLNPREDRVEVSQVWYHIMRLRTQEVSNILIFVL